jgi:hypothetical protein
MQIVHVLGSDVTRWPFDTLHELGRPFTAAFVGIEAVRLWQCVVALAG